MELVDTVKTIEEVAEPFRRFYMKAEKEEDGFKLIDFTGVKTPGEVQGLEDNKNTILKEKKTVEGQLKSFTDAGFSLEDAEGYLEYKRKKEEEEARNLKDKGSIDPATQKKLTTLETERNAQAQEIARLNAELEDRLLTEAVNEVLADPEIKGRPHMLIPDIKLKRQIRVVTEDDKKLVRVMDGDSAVTGSDGKPISLKSFIQTNYLNNPQWRGAFEALGKGGSGAITSTEKQGTDGSQNKTPTERLQEHRRSQKGA